MSSLPAKPLEPVSASDIHWRPLLIVAVVAFLVLGLGLGSTRLWDEDEGYFASAAAEMYERGDLIVPTFNQELFGHKPPMMYWGMMAGFQLFGVNEFGARVVSAMFGMATALLLCIVGTRLFNPRVGLVAGIVMGSSLMFSVVARAATPDAHLTFFALLAFYFFVSNNGLAPRIWSAERGTSRSGSWRGWAAAYAAMALGVLTKGPIGLLFPMAVIGLYLLVTTPLKYETTSLGSTLWQKFGPLNFFRTIWQMRPLTAIVLTLAIAGPWYLLVDLQTQGRFLSEFFGVHHFQRFSSPMDNHSGPFYYYLLACIIGLFPWSVFVVPAGRQWWIGLRNQDNHQRASLIFVSCWAGVYLVIFSLARTKLPNYVLPAYPALALILAHYVDKWLTSPEKVSHFWLRGALSSLVGVGILLTAGLVIAGHIQFGGQTLLDRAHIPTALQQQTGWLAMIGLPVIIGGSLAWIFAEQKQAQRAYQMLTVTAVTMFLLVWNVAAPLVDRFQAPQTIAAGLRDQSQSPIRIATLGFFRPSMIFYAQQPIDCYEDACEASEVMSGDEPVYLIMTAGKYDDFAASIPADVEVVQRLPGFPAWDDLIVIARRTTIARSSESLRR